MLNVANNLNRFYKQVLFIGFNLKVERFSKGGADQSRGNFTVLVILHWCVDLAMRLG